MFRRLRRTSLRQLANGSLRPQAEIRGKRIRTADKGFFFGGITLTGVSVASGQTPKRANSGHFPASTGKSPFRRRGGGGSRTRTCHHTVNAAVCLSYIAGPG